VGAGIQFHQLYGSANSTLRTDDQTAIAKFWTANVIRQYNRLVRDLADTHHLKLVQTARLAAMVNLIGADAQISVMHAKYHYLFWRSVTATDPINVDIHGFDAAGAAGNLDAVRHFDKAADLRKQIIGSPLAVTMSALHPSAPRFTVVKVVRSSRRVSRSFPRIARVVKPPP
jgi:hypothetical protein